jgi:hypothetical protein
VKNGFVKMAVAGVGAVAVVGGTGYAVVRAQGNDLSSLKASAVGKLFNNDVLRVGNAHLSQGVLLGLVVTAGVGYFLYAKVL